MFQLFSSPSLLVPALSNSNTSHVHQLFNLIPLFNLNIHYLQTTGMSSAAGRQVRYYGDGSGRDSFIHLGLLLFTYIQYKITYNIPCNLQILISIIIAPENTHGRVNAHSSR